MIGQVFIILFRRDKAFLTAEKSLALGQLELPPVAKIFKLEAYWTIRVLNFFDSTGRLFCEVLKYEVGDTDFPNHQKEISHYLKNVSTIGFRDINTDGLLRTLEFPTQTSNHLANEKSEKIKEIVKQTIIETFLVSIKNVHFKQGFVSVDRKLNFCSKTVNLCIHNLDIIEEYDSIKNYFANILETKKIKVTVYLELTNGEITSAIAKSPEIDKINNEIIQTVKFELIKSIRRKALSHNDKPFTIEELFETCGEENLKSGTFYSNEQDFIEDLLKITDSRHYKQLRFLSSKHQYQVLKLRFIAKPISFIFLIEGINNYYFVWETLDTEEATYIWHTDKNLQHLKDMLQKIEDTIGIMKVQGKTAYIHSNDDCFCRIYHDYAETGGGFVKWKSELESLLL